MGLAHIVQVRCMYPDYHLVNDVPTGSKHVTPNGGQAWNINAKLEADNYKFMIYFITNHMYILGDVYLL